MSRLADRFAPLLAGLFYGGWAAYSNAGHSLGNALLAGLIQGGFAYLSTLLLNHCVHWLLKVNIHGEMPRTRTFLECSLFILLIPATLHWLAETPEILAAMLPGLVVGHGYLFYLVTNPGHAVIGQE